MLKRDSSHVWSSTDDSHHPTAFNLRCVWQRRASQRDRNLCDQHENNIKLTTGLNEKVKKQKKRLPNEEASTPVPLATRCTLINSHRRVHHLHLRLPRTLFLFSHSRYIVKFQAYMSGRADVDVCIQSCVGACLCFSRHNEERAISSVLLVSVWRHRWRPFKPKIPLGVGLSDLAASPSFGPIRPFFSHYLFFFFLLIRLRFHRLLICSTLQLHSGLGSAQGEGKIMGNKVSTLAWARRCWCEEEGKQCSEVTFKQRGH